MKVTVQPSGIDQGCHHAGRGQARLGLNHDTLIVMDDINENIF